MEGSYIYSFWGLNNPKYAIQINNGHYIVSDYGNNRIIELDPTLPDILNPIRTYSMAGVVYFDYSEANDTLLITSETLNLVKEIVWTTGAFVRQSTCTLFTPQCATYKQKADQQKDVSKIVIADTGNNRIVKCNRTSNVDVTLGTYEFMYYYKVNSSAIHEISSFYRPYRVFQYYDGNICVVEEKGRPIDFTTIESSSSSSSSEDVLWMENGDEVWTEGGVVILLE